MSPCLLQAARVQRRQGQLPAGTYGPTRNRQLQSDHQTGSPGTRTRRHTAMTVAKEGANTITSLCLKNKNGGCFPGFIDLEAFTGDFSWDVKGDAWVVPIKRTRVKGASWCQEVRYVSAGRGGMFSEGRSSPGKATHAGPHGEPRVLCTAFLPLTLNPQERDSQQRAGPGTLTAAAESRRGGSTQQGVGHRNAQRVSILR